jgi:hypothetical protein
MEVLVMARPRAQARPPLHVSRDFERSRLDEQLLAAAYELATPVIRRPLPDEATTTRQAGAAEVDGNISRTTGGFGA